MDLDLSDIDGLCARPRCGLPIAGAGKAYGLCAGHGHEERNRRLAECDARAKTPTVRPITRGLTTPPVTRPLRAVVGARPTPTPIAPSKATEMAKESLMPPKVLLTLRVNADAHPDLCRIADCADPPRARGLCSRHHGATIRAGTIEAVALPAKVGGRPRRPALSEKQIAVKIEAAERRELEQLRASDARLRDALAASADKLQVLVTGLNLDPAGDLAKQARDIAAWMGAAIDATNAFGGTTPADLRDAVADAVADTHPRPPAANQPASQVFDLYQLGHVHRGPLRGYIDGAGLFRATDGAVYGAIFSAVPVTRPVLGEPTAGDAVWVRTSIAEVTPGGIYLDDGGRMPHGAWQPHRVRPAKAVSAAASFSASALGDAPSDDDDIPF